LRIIAEQWNNDFLLSKVHFEGLDAPDATTTQASVSIKDELFHQNSYIV
jgi:hypothetical protein